MARFGSAVLWFVAIMGSLAAFGGERDIPKTLKWALLADPSDREFTDSFRKQVEFQCGSSADYYLKFLPAGPVDAALAGKNLDELAAPANIAARIRLGRELGADVLLLLRRNDPIIRLTIADTGTGLVRLAVDNVRGQSYYAEPRPKLNEKRVESDSLHRWSVRASEAISAARGRSFTTTRAVVRLAPDPDDPVDAEALATFADLLDDALSAQPGWAATVDARAVDALRAVRDAGDIPFDLDLIDATLSKQAMRFSAVRDGAPLFTLEAVDDPTELVNALYRVSRPDAEPLTGETLAYRSFSRRLGLWQGFRENARVEALLSLIERLQPDRAKEHLERRLRYLGEWIDDSWALEHTAAAGDPAFEAERTRRYGYWRQAMDVARKLLALPARGDGRNLLKQIASTLVGDFNPERMRNYSLQGVHFGPHRDEAEQLRRAFVLETLPEHVRKWNPETARLAAVRVDAEADGHGRLTAVSPYDRAAELVFIKALLERIPVGAMPSEAVHWWFLNAGFPESFLNGRPGGGPPTAEGLALMDWLEASADPVLKWHGRYLRLHTGAVAETDYWRVVDELRAFLDRAEHDGGNGVAGAVAAWRRAIDQKIGMKARPDAKPAADAKETTGLIPWRNLTFAETEFPMYLIIMPERGEPMAVKFAAGTEPDYQIPDEGVFRPGPKLPKEFFDRLFGVEVAEPELRGGSRAVLLPYGQVRGVWLAKRPQP